MWRCGGVVVLLATVLVAQGVAGPAPDVALTGEHRTTPDNERKQSTELVSVFQLTLQTQTVLSKNAAHFGLILVRQF